MGEAGLPGLLIFGSDVVPDVYGYDWCFVVFVDYDTQAIVQNKLFVGDIEVGKAHYGVKSSR
jgi:hypothetical protein